MTLHISKEFMHCVFYGLTFVVAGYDALFLLLECVVGFLADLCYGFEGSLRHGQFDDVGAGLAGLFVGHLTL